MKRSRLLPDFVFLDNRGTKHTWGDVLGDFTIMAFTHNEKTTHGPACELLTAMVAENRGENRVDVRGIDVHSPGAACDRHDACHVVDTQTGVLVLCDPTGAIRHAYDVGQQDRFFVIGPDRYVIDSAWDVHIERLRLQLSLDVALCTEGVTRMPPRKLAARHAGFRDRLLKGRRMV